MFVISKHQRAKYEIVDTDDEDSDSITFGPSCWNQGSI